MTVMLTISAKLAAKLRKRATAAGKDVAGFVMNAVEEKLNEDQSFGEILAPVHAAFRKSGMSEKRAMELFDRARAKVRRGGRKGLKAS